MEGGSPFDRTTIPPQNRNSIELVAQIGTEPGVEWECMAIDRILRESCWKILVFSEFPGFSCIFSINCYSGEAEGPQRPLANQGGDQRIQLARYFHSSSQRNGNNVVVDVNCLKILKIPGLSPLLSIFQRSSRIRNSDR